MANPTNGSSSRYVVVSSDCHAGPSSMKDYAVYAEGEYRRAFADYLAVIDSYEARRGGSSFGLNNEDPTRNDSESRTSPQGLRFGYPGLWDTDKRHQDLDGDGVAAEVIYPQGSVPFGAFPAVAAIRESPVLYEIENDDLRVAGSRMYNRWLADLCSAAPKRHIGVAVMPMRDIEAAVREVRWARDNGLGGVSIPPQTLAGNQYLPTYNQPLYEPFWAVCEDLEMPIHSHGGGGSPAYGGGPETKAINFCEVDWFVGRRALWQMIFGGVFERHPGLKYVITEQRAGWIPGVIAELDNIYEAPKANVRHLLPLRPSDYFGRNCFVGASFFSRLECEKRYEIGLEQIMWGSDYPHSEGSWPWTHEAYRQTFAGVPQKERRLMLGENALRCYNLDVDALRTIADRIGPTDEDIDLPLPKPPEGSWISWAFRQHGAWV